MLTERKQVSDFEQFLKGIDFSNILVTCLPHNGQMSATRSVFAIFFNAFMLKHFKKGQTSVQKVFYRAACGLSPAAKYFNKPDILYEQFFKKHAMISLNPCSQTVCVDHFGRDAVFLRGNMAITCFQRAMNDGATAKAMLFYPF